MGTHPIFESDFDCLTAVKLGGIGSVLSSTTSPKMPGVIVDLSNAQQFEQEIGGKRAVVHFWAPWADQCTQMDEIMNALNEVYGEQLLFARCEAEEVPEIAQKFTINAVPTIVLYDNGKEVQRINGVEPAQLNEHVEKFASGASLSDSSKPVETLNERIHRLIHQDAIMIFMKGAPEQPRCRFSKAMMELFKEVDPEGIQFSSFSILDDEDVRQGIKEYSNWPSFPQLYIEGELIGGLDVMKELHEAGELLDLFNDADKLKTKLKYVTTKSKVLLCMSGSPSAPATPPSKDAVALLQGAGVDFGHFDVSSDNELAEEMKKESKFSDYPQLYHNGKHVGGSEVIKEMSESGKLAEMA